MGQILMIKVKYSLIIESYLKVYIEVIFDIFLSNFNNVEVPSGLSGGVWQWNLLILHIWKQCIDYSNSQPKSGIKAAEILMVIYLPTSDYDYSINIIFHDKSDISHYKYTGNIFRFRTQLMRIIFEFLIIDHYIVSMPTWLASMVIIIIIIKIN